MAGQGTKRSTPGEQAGLLADLFREGQLVLKLMGDPRVNTAAKVALPALAALYLLSPVDFVPDFVPVLGQMDDLAILLLAARLFVSLAPAQVVAEHRRNIRNGSRAGQPASSTRTSETVDGDYRIIE
jgi:uncharacterized membrane protein YkvA (DUF1232 family)